jgi:hypothetical protein
MVKRLFCVVAVCLVIVIIFVFLASCKSPTAPKNLPTIVSFYASPDTIDKGESTTLYWSTLTAATAIIDHGVGSVSASGNMDVKPTQTTTYTLTVGNPDGTVTAQATVTVKEIAVLVLDGTPKKKMTSYGCPYFEGYVKNIGQVTGYNSMIEFHAYSDTHRITIIDTASGFPSNLGNITPGQRAKFEAIFFNLTSWDQVKSWDYTITWLNINARPELRNGVTEGWGL